MQETLSDNKVNDGPTTTIVDQIDVKTHEKQPPAEKTSEKATIASNFGDVEQINKFEKPVIVAMEDDQTQSEYKKEKKVKAQKEEADNNADNKTTNGDTRNGNQVSKDDATRKPTASSTEPSRTTIGDDHSQNDNISASEGEKKNGKMEPAKDAATTPTDSGPPVMRGTLSLDLNGQRHLIRGMWNFEYSSALSAQRFELARNLEPHEDKTNLAVDGVFNGSFSLAYLHTTSKGKQKERSKVIQETGVEIKFTPIEGKKGEYNVDGKGTNQFGVFYINGTATPSTIVDDPTMNVVLRKRYEPAAIPAETSAAAESTASSDVKPVKKNNSTAVPVQSTTSAGAVEADTGPLPEPTKSFPTGVVALRGTLYKEESMELGTIEVVHRINGMWAGGLDLILADPQNVQGFCNRFEYEHKSSSVTQQFPVSGRYSGWFELMNESDGTRTRINERDVTLKFRLNSAGYHNIEGKGSNVFGKYTITGTLTLDNIITIFRVFQPRKIKTKTVTAEDAPTTLTTPDPTRRPSAGLQVDQRLKLGDVDPSTIDPTEKNGGEPYDAINPPATGTYSAVSQGVLRVNEDGSHSCQGKWAVTREHFTNSLTSNFNFRLETHHAQDALTASQNDSTNGEVRNFPLDSALYKGSFQMKKGGGSRYQTIVDEQIVMKFRKNKSGSFNVYGTGINAIGEFNLLGTLVMSGKSGGQVELYRIYKPEKLANPTEVLNGTSEERAVSVVDSWSMSAPAEVTSNSVLSSMPERGGLVRRESTRMSKLPSRLEEDDPSAQLTRIMEKCQQILIFIRDRDAESGGYFREPVDPVALGIPTYYQVIKEPMDLRTIQRKLDSNEIATPEEFMRLARLVFENAMTFNINPANVVHVAARSLLVRFNEKIKDVERLVQTYRRTHGNDDDGKGKKKKKDDKKRKRAGDEGKSLKRQRLDEIETMTAANSNAISAIMEAAPSSANAPVTRVEFNLLLGLIQQLQRNMILTHSAVAELSSDSVEAESANTDFAQSEVVTPTPKASSKSVSVPAPVPATEKKQVKRKTEPAKPVEPQVTEDEVVPLTGEEKEWLTEAIGELPEEHLNGVSQIIREAAPVGADDVEIEIDLDELDDKTQRKLLRHVLKFVKKSKPKPKKRNPKPQVQQVHQPKKQTEKPPPAKKQKQESKEKGKAPADSFFSFGNKDDSDSDSDSSDDGDDENAVTSSNKGSSNDFNLGTGLGDINHDDDDDLESDGMAGGWGDILEPVTQTSKKDEDLDWAAAAREQVAASKARDADRKAREEKRKKEVEEANKKALADAAKRKEELLAKKAEDQEQKEKEDEKARLAAREAARAEAQNVEQTFDFDAQREIMKQLEASAYLDNESTGGASPSSDFGF